MMKIITAFFFLISWQLSGQNIRTSSIKWQSVSTFNVSVGETLEDTTMVISYPDHIEWRSMDNTLKSSFSITETNGSWSNVANNGQITFEVDSQGKKGTAFFQKESERIRIRFMISTEKLPEVFELTVTTTELL